MRVCKALLAGVALAALAACGGGGDESGGGGGAYGQQTGQDEFTKADPALSGSDPQVEIRNSQFSPNPDNVTVGTEITWTNDDAGATHTVTSGTRDAPDGKFDESLSSGGSFSFTFTEAGSFDYFCRNHPSMNAKVVVG